MINNIIIGIYSWGLRRLSTDDFFKNFCHFSCQARAGEGDQHQEELAHD